MPSRPVRPSSRAPTDSVAAVLILLAAVTATAGLAHARVIRPPGRIVIGGDDTIVITDDSDDLDGDRGAQAEHEIEWGLVADFQRVDGIVFGLEQEFSSDEDDGVRLHLSEAYSFHRERFLYQAALERPLLPGANLVLGAGFFRQTRPFDGLDERIIGNGENTLAALLVKEDYRDYYEEQGGGIFLRQPLGTANEIRVEYLQSTHRPLSNSTRTSLTRWGEDFRINPQAERGDLRAFRFSVNRDSRERGDRAPGTAQWHRLEWERANGGLGGDFDYSRLLADLRHYVKVSPGQSLALRLLWGSALSGRLPTQKEFALGGIGTLRAHEYKEFVGDQVLLTNLEYRFDVGRDYYSLAFVDIGATAFGEGQLSDQRFALDGGLGFGTKNGRAEVTIARDLHRSDAPFKAGFRLNRAF
jgi:hemolysin activation/secretion protein